MSEIQKSPAMLEPAVTVAYESWFNATWTPISKDVRHPLYAFRAGATWASQSLQPQEAVELAQRLTAENTILKENVAEKKEMIGMMATRIAQLERVVESLCTFPAGWKLVPDTSSVMTQTELPHGGSCMSCVHWENAPDGACRGCFDPPDSISPRLTHWQARITQNVKVG